MGTENPLDEVDCCYLNSEVNRIDKNESKSLQVAAVEVNKREVMPDVKTLDGGARLNFLCSTLDRN